MGEDGDGVEFPGHAVAVLPISGPLSPALWHGFAGLLGYDVLRECVLQVDHDRQRLTLTDPADFRPPGSAAGLSFTLAGGVPVVPMKLDDRIDGNFLVDLGSTGGVLLQSAFAERHGIRPAKTVTGVGLGFGGGFAHHYFRMSSAQLGPLRWTDPIVGIIQASAGALAGEEYAGSIGNQVLERFVCTFDFERHRLYLSSSARAAERDRFTRVGAILARSGDTVTAVQVLAGSPAERAGLRVGDVVRTIDGRAATSWTIDGLRERFESSDGSGAVIFGVARGDRRTEIVVHKVSML